MDRPETPELPPAAYDALARRMVVDSLGVRPGQTIAVSYVPAWEGLAMRVNEVITESGATPVPLRRDYEADAERARQMPPDEFARYAQSSFREAADTIRASDGAIRILGTPPEFPPGAREVYFAAGRQTQEPLASGEVPFSYLAMPTPQDAQLVGIPYADYVESFLEAFDAPVAEVATAQDRLIETLNRTETLRFVNEGVDEEGNIDPTRRTDLTMKLRAGDTQHTFGNSPGDGNNPIPSEVFSAPVVDSVNGQMYVQGPILFEGRVMEGIRMQIENGEIVQASVQVGDEALQQTLNEEPGARRFGEVGIGTNGNMRVPSPNPDWVEKRAGTFHVAIGNSNQYDTYRGVPVNVNNGNSARIHLDVVSDLTNGRIEADGVTIQERGHFVDPALAILNPQPERTQEREPEKPNNG
jgi:aminopeptidase